MFVCCVLPYKRYDDKAGAQRSEMFPAWKQRVALMHIEHIHNEGNARGAPASQLPIGRQCLKAQYGFAFKIATREHKMEKITYKAD